MNLFQGDSQWLFKKKQTIYVFLLPTGDFLPKGTQLWAVPIETTWYSLDQIQHPAYPVMTDHMWVTCEPHV